MARGWTVNSEQRLVMACADLKELWNEKKWIKVSVTFNKRSLDANALSQVFYTQISEESGQCRDEVVRFCKHKFGVPIMREDKKCNAFLDAIGFDFFDERKQLACMKYIAVTSIFDVDQMKKYINLMIAHYAEFGIELVSTNEK